MQLRGGEVRKCQTHHTYNAKLKPRAKCVECLLMWYQAETKRMDRLSIDAFGRFDYGLSRADAAMSVCDLLVKR
jgi:hypothetical protein